MTKKVLAFAGLLVAALLVAPSAHAQTTATLEAQVQALLAQIASLQGGASTAGCYSFTRDLTQGSQGADVTALQNYLAAKGYFTVAATGYFGPITASALASWQAANGVMPAAGYFGPISRAKYNSMCGGVVVVPGDDDDDNGDDDDDDFFGGDDEGSLENFDQMSSLAGEEVGEDEEDVEVLGVEFEADGADQMVERVTVVIDTPSDVAEDDLDDFIQDVSVWLDGEELGRMDVEDASYDREDDEYTFRFNGLDGIVEDGENAELTVAVTGPSSVNGDIEGEGWSVEIPNDGIRASSPNGVTETYDGVGPETFTVESFASANDVELDASKSDENPDEQTVTGDSDDEFTLDLLGFTLDAEGSDITVFGLMFDIATSTGVDVDAAVNDVMLTCGGDEWSENVSATGTVSFGDLELDIDEGDSIDCMLSVELNAIDGTDVSENDVFSADLLVDRTDAEDQTGEGLSSDDLTGSANGNDQTVLSEGLGVSGFETDKEVTFTADDTGEESIGQWTIEFDVTANETDIFLDKSDEEIDGLDGGADNGTGENGEGVVYTVTGDFGGEGFATSTATLECVSNCGDASDNTADEFFIEEGDTETYRLTVNVTARQGATNHTYGVWIDSINWDSSDTAASTEFYTSNLGEDSDADAGNQTLLSL